MIGYNFGDEVGGKEAISTDPARLRNPTGAALGTRSGRSPHRDWEVSRRMSYYPDYYNRPRKTLAEHEKTWSRTKAVAWDDKWQALSVEARRAYLTEIKAPTREGSINQPSIVADRVEPAIVEELTAAKFIKVEPAKGKSRPRSWRARPRTTSRPDFAPLIDTT